jgi:translation initiation factor 2 subunit 2
MSNTYNTYDLLDKVYDELEKNEKVKNRSKMVLTRPEVSRANRKTFVVNFREICKKLNRTEMELQKFFDDELRKKSSIDVNGVLIIQASSFQQNAIQSILVSYIKNYVLCKECSSNDTKLLKENRILFLECNICKSKKAI